MKEKLIIFGFINTLFVQSISFYKHDPIHNFNPLNMIYLTTQINFLQFLYFIASFISLFYISKGLKSLVQFLSSFHLIYGCLIGIAYHIIGVIEKEVGDLSPYSKLYSFWTHGFVCFVSLVDVFLMVKEHGNFLKFKKIFPYVLTFDLIYTIWSYFCYFQNGRWPYEVLNQTSFFGTILMQTGLILFSFFVCYLSCKYSELCFKFHENMKLSNKNS